MSLHWDAAPRAGLDLQAPTPLRTRVFLTARASNQPRSAAVYAATTTAAQSGSLMLTTMGKPSVTRGMPTLF